MFYLYTEVKGAFIIYGLGGGEPEGGVKISRRILGGGEGGQVFFSILFGRGDFVSTHYFWNFFFHKNYITCILILVGALQQHKGMFLKHGRRGKIFPAVSWRGRRFFSRVFSRGGGRFFFAYWFCQTTSPLPAINNERSLIHFCLFTNKCGWSIGQDFCVKDATYHVFFIPLSLSEHR